MGLAAGETDFETRVAELIAELRQQNKLLRERAEELEHDRIAEKELEKLLEQKDVELQAMKEQLSSMKPGNMSEDQTSQREEEA